MPYTLTAKQFFEGHLSQRLAHLPELKEVGGVVEFEIGGNEGGTWLVDLAEGRALQGVRPDCIVRAQERDFMALVEGRMSVSDGLITQRLQLSGEATRLTRLGAALERLREREGANLGPVGAPTGRRN